MKVEEVKFPVISLKKDTILIEKPIEDLEWLYEKIGKRLRKMDAYGDFDESLCAHFKEIVEERIKEYPFNRIFIPFQIIIDSKIKEVYDIVSECDVDWSLQGQIEKRIGGMKLGRFLRREILKHYPNDKNVEKILNASLPQLLDYTYTGWLVLSNYPIDILYPNYGNFDSCLSGRRQYVSGCLAYLNSPNWLISFITAEDTPSNDYFTFRRRVRWFTALNMDKKLIALSRGYPYNDLEEKELVVKELHRVIFKENLKEVEIIEEDEGRDFTYNITGHIAFGADRTYFDVIDTANNCDVTNDCAFIDSPICPICGEEFYATDHIVCGECGNYYEEETYICCSCECPITDPYWADGDPYCASCFDEIYTYCEHCNEVVARNDAYALVKNNGVEYYLCGNCIDYYDYCDCCGRYFESCYPINCGTAHSYLLCKGCIDMDSSIMPCLSCGYFYEEDFLNEEGLCVRCAVTNKNIKEFEKLLVEEVSNG